MRVEKDFKEFIALLNKNNVRYLIIGGFAYSYYAEPRFTIELQRRAIQRVPSRVNASLP